MSYYIIDNKPNIIDRIKLNVVFAYIALQNSLIKIFRLLIFKNNPDPASINKILIFRIGSLGDGICALPAIGAIKNHFINAQLDILTKTEYKGLISIDMLIKEQIISDVINYTAESPQLFFSEIKKKKYDLIIALPPNRINLIRLLRDMIFFRLAGIRAGFGWRVSKTTLFRKTIERFVLFSNEVERLSLMLEEQKIKVDRDFFPLNIQKEDEKFVDNVLTSKRIVGNNFMTIAIGGKGEFKHWPISYFQRICEHFNSKYTILILGGNEDRTKAELLTQTPNVVNLCGVFTPMQSAYCLKRSIFLLSNDTGPLHLCYSVGTKVFGIYSASDFRGSWYPQGKGTVFRKNNIACAACYGHKCMNNICVQNITPDEVIFKIEEFISQ